MGAAGTLLATALVSSPAMAAAPTSCQGQRATIVGTERSDTLQGTARRDVIVAGGGDDEILSAGGNDLVCAGDGFDHVRLGPGADRAHGGAGDDTIHGQSGRDLLLGEGAVDMLVGGTGDDRLRGGTGRAIIIEALIGGPGDDVLDGGPGLDSAQFFDSPRGVQVHLGTGVARGHGSDRLVRIEGVVGSNHADLIVGDQDGNGLFGQAGDDTIRGGASGRLADGTADVLSGDQGDDTLVGGSGQDLATYARIPVAVVVDLASGTARGQGGDKLSGVEAVQGSRLDDRLLGGPGGDLIGGSGGDDLVDGRGGADTVFYNDVRGPVRVELAPTLVASAQAGATEDGTGTGEAAGIDVLRDVENIWGTNGADELHGDDAANRIRALGGDDLLFGYSGVDRLDGGDGEDSCFDPAEESVDCETVPTAWAGGPFAPGPTP
jgi:Ca2+-binding RTX toxin-like protein